MRGLGRVFRLGQGSTTNPGGGGLWPQISGTSSGWHEVLLSSLVTLGAEAVGVAGGAVFGLPPAHPFAPHLERRGLHRLAHQLDHLLFRNSELVVDCLKGGAVLPSHLDDAIELVGFKAAHGVSAVLR